MNRLLGVLTSLAVVLFGCGDGDRSAPAGPAGKVSADCSLAEIFSGKEGCPEDPSLDVVPEGYVAPVDSTATAPSDSTEPETGTAPSDSTEPETAPSDSTGTETAPADSTEPETETPSDTSDPDPVVPDPVVIHVPVEEEPDPEVARSEDETLTAEQSAARAELTGLDVAYTGATFRLVAKAGDLWTVKLFVQAGMDLESADDELGWTALFEAAYAGRLAVVKYLVGAGANIEARDEDGYTVLMNAAGIANNLPVVRFLVESGADVLAVASDGKTAWSVAVTVGNTAIADYLKDPQAWVLVPLSAADARAELDKRGIAYTDSAFVRAAQLGNWAVVRLFVWAGKSVDASDKYGTGALHWAARGGLLVDVELSVVEFLVGAGADVNARGRNGATPLHVAARFGHLSVVEFLVGAGADVHATNHWGVTALHDAAGNGHLSVVQYLVGAGADVNARDNSGDTPRDDAAGRGHTEIVSYFDSLDDDDE